METPVRGLCLLIGGQSKDVRPEVLERATRMIRVMLEAASLDGEWRYIITGPSESLGNPSQYSLEVCAASELVGSRVHVRLRASITSGGTLAGLLTVPPTVPRDRLVERLMSVASLFNRSSWQNVLDTEKRQPAFYVGKPTVVTPLKRTLRESEDDEWKPLPRVSSPPMSGSSRVTVAKFSVPVRRQDPSHKSLECVMQDSNTERTDRLATLLRQVLTQSTVTEGAFFGQGITKFSQPLFPHEAVIWQRTGVLRELMGLGWIRHVGQGEYQVEQSFATQHHLELVIVPRDKVVRGVREQKREHSVGVGSESFQHLLDQQAALQARICVEAQHERQRLVTCLEEAQESAARVNARVTQWKELLATFDAKHGALLTLGAKKA